VLNYRAEYISLLLRALNLTVGVCPPLLVRVVVGCDFTHAFAGPISEISHDAVWFVVPVFITAISLAIVVGLLRLCCHFHSFSWL
jgi:hypothetical protein